MGGARKMENASLNIDLDDDGCALGRNRSIRKVSSVHLSGWPLKCRADSFHLIGAFLSGALVLCQSDAFSQTNNANIQCANLISSISMSNNLKSVCRRIDELKTICSQGSLGPAALGALVEQLNDDCKSGQDETGSQQKPTLPLATPSRPLPAKNDLGPRQAPVLAQRQVLAANRQQVLNAYPVLLLQSLSRVAANPAFLKSISDLGSSLFEAYFQRRKGSVLDQTSEKDDALADSRGFKKRESENFVVYYRAGDMNRAESLLQFAEGSIEPIGLFLNHFPTPRNHNGRKLPIYIGSSLDEYIVLSTCPNWSDACVVHSVFDDGFISTMYVSPVSFSEGKSADQRIERFHQIVQHELTHYAQFDLITGNTVHSIPTWLIEGLASYIAKEDGRLSVFKRAGKSAPLLSLSDLSQGLKGVDDPTLFYAEAYSIVAMLAAQEGIENTRALVLDVSQQEDLDRALARTLGITLEQFDVRWRKFAAERYGIKIPASRGLVPQVNVGRADADTTNSADENPIVGCWHRADSTDYMADGTERALDRHCTLNITGNRITKKCDMSEPDTTPTVLDYNITSPGSMIAARANAAPSAPDLKTAEYRIRFRIFNGDRMQTDEVVLRDVPDSTVRNISMWNKETTPPPPTFAGCVPH
jgi:hypothetical protein